MVKIGSGAKRQLEGIRLSRYACYLIVKNADASKAIVALGQTQNVKIGKKNPRPESRALVPTKKRDLLFTVDLSRQQRQ